VEEKEKNKYKDLKTKTFHGLHARSFQRSNFYAPAFFSEFFEISATVWLL
jgi:hypothetical protein